MKIEQFLELSSFNSLSEIDKIKHLAFYHYCQDGMVEFNLGFMVNQLEGLRFGRPNSTRLRKNIIADRGFLNGSSSGTFKLHYNTIKQFEDKYPQLNEKSEDIVTDDIIIPDKLYLNTRGYIEQLAKQINGCYNENFFDACAVIMRRLLEVLLIHSYEYKGRLGDIEENGGYKNLSYIINHTTTNRVLSLSKESYDTLDDFRVLGNFSAHKIHYNSKRKDVKKVANQYRLVIEELLYESGIKK